MVQPLTSSAGAHKPGPKPAIISNPSSSSTGAGAQQQAVIGTLVAPVGSGAPPAGGLPLAGGTITLLSPNSLPPASANISAQIRFVSSAFGSLFKARIRNVAIGW